MLGNNQENNLSQLAKTGKIPFIRQGGYSIRQFKEKLINYFFVLNGILVILFILLIFLFLAKESYRAFYELSILDFLSAEDGTFQWYPTSENPRYSIVPLILGTFLTSLPAVMIASVFGILSGIYLAEIASDRAREILKPVIELFSGIPTVVLGFIMLTIGSVIIGDIFRPANRLNAFLGSLGLSLIIVPIISTLTEEALSTVPRRMREASFSLGATKWQTIVKVVLPSALNGISAGLILGFGRAAGETMIVLMATGNAANMTLDIFKSVRTMTATIAAEMGEVSQESVHYFSLFLIGGVLFIITSVFNIAANIIITRMKAKLQQSHE